MKKNTIFLLGGIGIAVLIGLIVFIMGASAHNRDVDLRNQASAKQTNLSNYYDKMWKILKQKAGVTDQYKNSFKDIYTGLIAGRYANGNGGSLMKFIQESNPNFDASLYKDLMNSIEIERTGFYNEQESLIDIKREHDNLLQKWPSSWFLSGPPIQIHIVTSTKTEEVIKACKDDDVSLFNDSTKKK